MTSRTHYDGYPDHTLKILQIHYNTYEKAEALLRLGDLSRIGVQLEEGEGQEHSWANPHRDICLAYGRDRGETNSSTRPRTNTSWYWCKGNSQWNYIFSDGQWDVIERG